METGNGKKLHYPREAEVIGESLRRILRHTERDSLDGTEHIGSPLQICPECLSHPVAGGYRQTEQGVSMARGKDLSRLGGIDEKKPAKRSPPNGKR